MYLFSFILFYNFCKLFGNIIPGTLFLPCGSDLRDLIYCEKLYCPAMWKITINISYYEHLRSSPNYVNLTLLNEFSLTENTFPYQNKFSNLQSIVFITQTHVEFHIREPYVNYYPFVKSLSINGANVCGFLCRTQTTPAPNIETTTEEISNNIDVRKICGRRKTKPYLNLVSNGNVADLGEWPWHAVIYLLNTRYANPILRCGGTIICRSFVVTAAHCTLKNNKRFEAKRFLVKAGVVDLSEHNCSSDICQSSVVKNVIPYPYYSRNGAGGGDIALLKLKHRFDWTDYVRPICIFQDYNKERLYGKYGTIVGFGATENKSKSDELLYAEVEVQSDDVCHASDSTFFSVLLNDFTFCAGNPNSDIGPGKGDSGGGLYISKKLDNIVVWTLQGIISMGKPLPDHIRNVDLNTYVIYTDVIPYYSWIGSIAKWPIHID